MEEAGVYSNDRGYLIAKFLIFLIAFSVFSGTLYPQVNMNYELLNYMAARQPDPDPNDRDQVKAIPNIFVKEVFLNSVLNQSSFDAEDNNADYGLVNQLMIDQFAEQIVDKEVIDLSHITLDE